MVAQLFECQPHHRRCELGEPVHFQFGLITDLGPFADRPDRDVSVEVALSVLPSSTMRSLSSA
jgi:hypothetical protein